MVILECHICAYYEIDPQEEPCLTCLIKSYVEGDKEVFEEVNDGEET